MEVLKSLIDSLLTITKTRIIRENSSSNNYDIIVDKYSSGNALEMSVYFYETGLFEYSIPNTYGYYCDEYWKATLPISSERYNAL